MSVQDAQQGHIVSTFAGNQKSVVAMPLTVMSSGQANAEISCNLAPALNCNRDGAPIAFQSTANVCDAAAAGNNISPSLRKSDPMAIAFKPGQSADARSIGAQEEVACTLEAGGGGNNRQAVAFGFNGDQSAKARSMGDREEQSPTLRSEAPSHVASVLRSRTPGMIENSTTTVVRHNTAVRRLTPTECERLQGFPDGFTAIPWRGKEAGQCPDGPRYKALGNSMAVPVMRWIGQRIDQVNEITGGECHQCKGTGRVCCGGKEGYFECCANTLECTECGRATA